MYHLVFAGDDGHLYDHPGLLAAGRTGDLYVEPAAEEMERMPRGASLALVPGGAPVGLDESGNFTMVTENPYTGGPAWAVGALLPQGYTRTLLPAFARGERDQALPLLGYTALAYRDGELYVAARLTEEPGRWDPVHFDTDELPGLVKERTALNPENRILLQLARCALDYSCFTAQNIFYSRWEGGIPVSPSCNAGCLGCISLQPAECCPAPQARIDFMPTPREVAGVAVAHLSHGMDPMVSFGQGCEGEPALAAPVLVRAIDMIRSATARGTINMNSNGGHTGGVRDICRAGLDAIRVSLISAREDTYQAYCRPSGFGLEDVRRTLAAAAEAGAYTSLNLLVFPGLTDRAGELEALLELVRDSGVKLIQLRNLNIDPDFLLSHIPSRGVGAAVRNGSESPGDILGIPALLEALDDLPGVTVGSYSRSAPG